MSGLGTPLLVPVFIAAAAATWVAGVYLSKTTDALDIHFGLGGALGGLILLAITGSLPKIAITASVALSGAVLSPSANVGGVSPTSIAVVVMWVCGVWIVNRVRLNPGREVHALGSKPGRKHVREPHPAGQHPYANSRIAVVALIFASGATFLAAATRSRSACSCSPTRPPAHP